MAGVAPEDIRARIATALSKIAARRSPEVTHNQVLMKWILKKGVFVVTTSTKVSRIHEYVATDNVSDLTDEEMVELEKYAWDVRRKVGFAPWLEQGMWA